MSSLCPKISLVCAAFVAVSGATFAQKYPSRTAPMVLSWAAGGTADLMARIASQKFSESFGQQFVVDNRPGAGGLTGTNKWPKPRPTATRCCSPPLRPTRSRRTSIRKSPSIRSGILPRFR